MRIFKFFDGVSKTRKEEIQEWIDKMQIQKASIVEHNNDYRIDVDANVHLQLKGLYELPYKFGVINGHFSVSCNNLTSLKNCPDVVLGQFDASGNKAIRSLEGIPRFVKAGIAVFDIPELKVIDKFPEHLKRRSNSGLEYSLVEENFTTCNIIVRNNGLKTLDGLPTEVYGLYDIYENPIEDYSNFPTKVTGKVILPAVVGFKDTYRQEPMPFEKAKEYVEYFKKNEIKYVNPVKEKKLLFQEDVYYKDIINNRF